MPDSRRQTSEQIAFQLAGEMCGWVLAFAGGDATGEVNFTPPGAPGLPGTYRIGSVKFEDITVEFSTGMTKPFYDWVIGALQRQYKTADGAIVEVGLASKVIGQLSFTNALITEITFPTLDATAKDESGIEITLTPKTTVRSKPDSTLSWKESQARKPWLSSNFRVAIDGLDCSGVSRIESMTVNVARDAAGKPQYLTIPHLAITMAESHTESFRQWHADFVINGNNSPYNEKSGYLLFLAVDLKEILFKIQLAHLGIFRLVTDDSFSDGVRRVRAEMYCGDLQLSCGPGAFG